MKKYQLWWDFVKTEIEAKKLCIANDNRMTKYMRQKHPSHYTPYEWSDTKESGLWYGVIDNANRNLILT